MRKHYITDAMVTLLPAVLAAGVGFAAVSTLARISLLVNGANGLTLTLGHLAMPLAVTVAIVWVINYTDID